MNETVLAALLAARWINFSATLFLFGAALFPFYAFEPRAALDPTLAERMRVAIVAAALAAVVSAGCWACSALASLADNWREIRNPETLSDFFLQTSFGSVWALRLTLCAVLLGLVLAERTSFSAPTGRTAALAVVSAALLASQAWLGHTAGLSGEKGWLATAAYASHVLGVGAWIGALQPLRLMVSQAHGGDDAAKRQASFALRRFSRVATAAVALLVLGGVSGAAMRLQSWQGLFTSVWGWTLGAKAGLLLLMLALAGASRFSLMPRLAGDGAAALAGLRRNVAIEQIAALLALAGAALLGLLPPPA